MARYLDTPPGEKTGADFRALREDRGWSRAQAAEMAELKEGAVYRIEHRSQFKAGEYEALARAFHLDEPSGPPVTPRVDAGTTPTADTPESHEGSDPGWDDGVQVLHEWNGLKVGDPCKLDDDPGARCTFQFYYRSPGQEYVQVQRKPGGRGGGPTHVRPVRPEKVLRMNGKPVVKS